MYGGEFDKSANDGVGPGTAKVYDSEELMMAALDRKEIEAGNVVIIRYEGPKGGPGMPEMLTPTSAIIFSMTGKAHGVTQAGCS